MAVTAVPPPYPSGAAGVERHKEYYFEDGNLVLQVDNKLFKVWDGTFRRHSEFFKDTTGSLLNINKVQDGSDDEHPLVLRGIQIADFERLLWILFPPVIGEYKAKTSEDWVAILDLADRWKFNDIRELAIKELAKFELDPVHKINLMQKYKIKRQWAYTSFVALCSRQTALEVKEGTELGIEMTVMISLAREKLEKWGRKKPEEVRKVVCEVFEVEAPPGTTTTTNSS